jgi:hypothetical protein
VGGAPRSFSFPLPRNAEATDPSANSGHVSKMASTTPCPARSINVRPLTAPDSISANSMPRICAALRISVKLSASFFSFRIFFDHTAHFFTAPYNSLPQKQAFRAVAIVAAQQKWSMALNTRLRGGHYEKNRSHHQTLQT